MIKAEITSYYKDIAWHKDDVIYDKLSDFYSQNTGIPTDEYIQKLEEEFGPVLNQITRLNNDRRLKSIATSMMWVRVAVIISLIASAAYFFVSILS